MTGLSLEKLDTPIPVYNLEVEDFNSYFVGDGVLVHNAGCNNKIKDKDGNYTAVVHIDHEDPPPHAHILFKGARLCRVFLDGSIDKNVRRNKNAMRFIEQFWDDILTLIKEYFPARKH